MKYIFIFSLLLLNACASVQSVSTSSVPAQRGKPITAESSKFIFLGFNFNNEYVDAVVQNLARQCPNGRVEGILTKQESINYFLYFFWTSKISASGYCVSANIASNSKFRKPSSADEGSNSEQVE